MKKIIFLIFIALAFLPLKILSDNIPITSTFKIGGDGFTPDSVWYVCYLDNVKQNDSFRVIPSTYWFDSTVSRNYTGFKVSVLGRAYDNNTLYGFDMIDFLIQDLDSTLVKASLHLDTSRWLSGMFVGAFSKSVLGADSDVVYFGLNTDTLIRSTYYHIGGREGGVPDSFKTFSY